MIFLLSTEKSDRVHQLPTGSGHEVGKVLPRFEANIEDSSPGQIEAGHHCQQHPSAKVRLRSKLLIEFMESVRVLWRQDFQTMLYSI